MQSYKFIISGRVQGVWYRRNVHVHASKSGFSGYVKNLSDGNVEAAVTCDEAKLADFIALLRRGSDLSRIDSIEQIEITEHFNGDFEVR